jgi:hypothetical protein
MNLKKMIKACEDFGFNEEITREMLWNEAYRIGRSRWWWGPMWMSSVKGWFRTQMDKLFRRGK